jgi:hypothetical protein
MGGNTKLGLAALSVFIAVFATNAGAQSAREIGVTAAVNPQAEGIPQSAESRTLQVGVNVLANERIVTSDGGQAQMLFLDESAFTVGPNSDVVLDEFVFDPNTGTGRIALTAAKGVFRMVGGKISKRTPVTLKTPTAVIGIRGGIALVNVAPNGATQATFLFGDQMTVGTAGGVQSVTRPGYSVSLACRRRLFQRPARHSITPEMTSFWDRRFRACLVPTAAVLRSLLAPARMRRSIGTRRFPPRRNVPSAPSLAA